MLLAPQPVETADSLPAFSAYGIELEYMLVERESLAIRPAAPAVLRRMAGVPDTAPAPQDASAGELGWSNELVAHVLELKNRHPGPLEGLGRRFHAETRAMDRRLSTLGVRLMPGGMHPWMMPGEAELWNHGNAAIYGTYDRIFNCASHGWANLQSMHVNLPFASGDEFRRLHAATRLIVPLLPALCASSPFMEGMAPGALCQRMEAYRTNAQAFPLITGEVVPDTSDSPAAYRREVLEPMYRSIAAHDPQAILQHEWLNSRGVIPRFERSALEIRVMDTQEHPQADVALAALAADSIRWLYEERTASLEAQQAFPTARLAAIFRACVRDAERAVVNDEEYLQLLGLDRPECRANELWQRYTSRLDAGGTPHRSVWGSTLTLILSRGPLARRLLKAAGPAPSVTTLRDVYTALCACLEEGRSFDP